MEFWTRGPGEISFGDFLRQNMGHAVPSVLADHERLTYLSSTAMLTFTWSAHRRVHTEFARGFKQCAHQCRGRASGVVPASFCKQSATLMEACQRAAWKADPAGALRPAGQELTLPFLVSKVHRGTLRIVGLVRNPADRLWSAFFTYPQFWGR